MSRAMPLRGRSATPSGPSHSSVSWAKLAAAIAKIEREEFWRGYEKWIDEREKHDG